MFIILPATICVDWKLEGAATVRPSPYWNGAPACKRTVVVGTYIYARYWIRLDQSTITIAP